MLPESFLKPSPPTPPSPKRSYEVGLESTALTIAQQQLNEARKDFLQSDSLPATHDLRRRANEIDGTLLPVQPDGSPRKQYEPHKIPRPRIRKDKEAATYFLDRNRLVNMWNGKWTKDSDWDVWDKVREKMERQFSNYRLVERLPDLKGWQEKQYRRRERKRKREEDREEGKENAGDENPRKKRCHAPIDFKRFERSALSLPAPEEVLAAVPPEGIRMELLLAKFWKPNGWDTERFCTMLHEIGHVNKYDKMFTVGKKLNGAGHEDGDIPIDPALLNTSSGNTCIEKSRMEVF